MKKPFLIGIIVIKMGNPIQNKLIDSITYELVDIDMDKEHEVLFSITAKEYRNLSIRAKTNYKK